MVTQQTPGHPEREGRALTILEKISEPGTYLLGTVGGNRGNPPEFGRTIEGVITTRIPHSTVAAVSRGEKGINFTLGGQHAVAGADRYLIAGDAALQVGLEMHGGSIEDSASEHRSITLTDSGIPSVEDGELKLTATQNHGRLRVSTDRFWDKSDKLATERWSGSVEIGGYNSGSLIEAAIEAINAVLAENKVLASKVA